MPLPAPVTIAVFSDAVIAPPSAFHRITGSGSSNTRYGSPTRAAARARNAVSLRAAETSLPVLPDNAAQSEAHERDDQRAEQRGHEAVDTKAQIHALRDPARQQKHERVDDEREQPKGHDLERQRQQEHDRADDHIDRSEDQRDDPQRNPIMELRMTARDAQMKTRNDPGRDEQADRIDRQPEQDEHRVPPIADRRAAAARSSGLDLGSGI